MARRSLKLKAIARQAKVDLPQLERKRRVQSGVSGVKGLGVSVGVHAILLGIMALWMLPGLIRREIIITAMFDSGTGDGQESLSLVETLDDKAIEIDPPADDQLDPKPEPVAVGLPEVEPLKPDPIDRGPSKAVTKTQTAKPSTGTSSAEAASVEGAVDRITAGISGLLEKEDLLVVWLLDSSQSLVDDRQRIAARLDPFFEHLGTGRGGVQHKLINTVVAFGKSTRERVSPTPSGQRIVEAVKSLPIDESGLENVFGAVNRCITTYRSKWQDKQMLIVVWTDETGDDSEQLEATIKHCLDNRVQVSVVGPSSVLGAETGLHAYTDPASNERFLVPVDRGPDSAATERIELGYWFRTLPPFDPRMNQQPNGPGLRRRPARRFELPAWYGGQDLVGIVSGFRPYALARLAAETQGSYTIFDPPEDRGPFRTDVMADYAPDYGPLDAYLKDIQSHPLRLAVHEAAKATIGKQLEQPEMLLFVKRDRHNPANFQRPYYSPAQFASRLRTSRRVLQQRAARMSRVVEQALACVSRDGKLDQPLDREYDNETSKRWRAWYDLTRGRLLATSTRLEEYRLAIDSLLQEDALGSDTNHVIFLPSVEMRSDSEYKARVEEAKSLLMRCVQQNDGTPWAYLAQRELAYGPGISIRQLSLTLGPAVPVRSSTAPPKF
ncbi:MAG: VWA domain-containing protein [Planctomycetota bacterium]|nr:VWA domain-containing protein [Planctomycetota bacterium]